MKRTPLKAGKPPARKTPLKGRNSKRAAKRYREAFGGHADTIRGLPCDLCAAPAPSDPHHVRTRAAGGTAKDLIPVCRTCHTRIHDGHGPSREHLTARAHLYWTSHGGLTA